MNEDLRSPGGPMMGRLTWIFTRATVRRLSAFFEAGVGAPGAAVCVLEPRRQLDPPQECADLAVRHWLACPSYAELADMIARNDLPGWVETVLYDCEAWPHTPPSEQADPSTYIQRAADLCHSVGLSLVAAPSMGLARRLVPGAKSGPAAYLALGLAEASAVYADGLHVQSQSLERQPASYGEFVRDVAIRVRDSASAPNVQVTAGLSTNPPGPPPSAAQLIACVQATAEMVAGFWLNVPVPGPWCPTCSPPRPELAYAVLRQLYGSI